ncbi:AGC family protein kinase [Histomonas meleagridis]|uniref:AGC family protein kinase n=1 Tax=Histomonas meleagridis TaxID=135588 RepID=UPI00355A6299|nr:AGC family protein kinase [Histomonas meleagridis]KAH0800672.1 AGC family protein kinase [Histomonas meleagridis]
MNISGFIEQCVLGEGSYGKVYKATRISDGQTYAIKIVNLSKLSRREIEDSINEIRIMASFTSPFIIRFHEAFCDQKRLCIVTEYAQLGDLSNLIARRKRKNKPLQEEAIWRFLLQILEGLRVLHSCGVLHRDLKTANVLLSAPDLAKIADLGISTVLHNRQLARTQIGTPLYLAPEVWKKNPYDQKCDMWSLGVLLYELMTFSFPFMGRTSEELARKICIGNYIMPKKYSAELNSVLKRLLQVNPLIRPSAEEVLNMECVKDRKHLLDMFQPKTPLRKSYSYHLLSTIKVPLNNIRNVNLPNPSYDEKNGYVKPIEQRMHMKKDAPLSGKDISRVSTPELKAIVDQDWWSPNKIPSDEIQRRKNPVRLSSIRNVPMREPIPDIVEIPNDIKSKAPEIRVRPQDVKGRVPEIRVPAPVQRDQIPAPRRIPQQYCEQRNLYQRKQNCYDGYNNNQNVVQNRDPRWRQPNQIQVLQIQQQPACQDPRYKPNNNQYNHLRQQANIHQQIYEPQQKLPVMQGNPRLRRVGIR